MLPLFLVPVAKVVTVALASKTASTIAVAAGTAAAVAAAKSAVDWCYKDSPNDIRAKEYAKWAGKFDAERERDARSRRA